MHCRRPHSNVWPLEEVRIAQPALPVVPLRVEPHPLVADPLLAEEDGARRVLGERVRQRGGPEVVPEAGRALLGEDGDADVGPDRGAA